MKVRDGVQTVICPHEIVVRQGNGREWIQAEGRIVRLDAAAPGYPVKRLDQGSGMRIHDQQETASGVSPGPVIGVGHIPVVEQQAWAVREVIGLVRIGGVWIKE